MGGLGFQHRIFLGASHKFDKRVQFKVGFQINRSATHPVAGKWGLPGKSTG